MSAIPAAESGKPVPQLVFVFAGESNSGGFGLNSQATPGELAARPSVQIMNLTSGAFAFEALHVGVNNLRDHAKLDRYAESRHGWEIGLANAVESGEFPGQKRVYLIKTGQGGSIATQWAETSPYWAKFVQRIDAAGPQLPERRQWVVWLSLGINDAIRKTPLPEWKQDVVGYLGRIKTKLPGAVIVMTQFQSMGYESTNEAIAQVAASEKDVVAVPANDASLIDSNHWDYAGLKTMAKRMAEATKAALAKRLAAAK